MPDYTGETYLAISEQLNGIYRASSEGHRELLSGL